MVHLVIIPPMNTPKPNVYMASAMTYHSIRRTLLYIRAAMKQHVTRMIASAVQIAMMGMLAPHRDWHHYGYDLIGATLLDDTIAFIFRALLHAFLHEPLFVFPFRLHTRHHDEKDDADHDYDGCCDDPCRPLSIPRSARCDAPCLYVRPDDLSPAGASSEATLRIPSESPTSGHPKHCP